MTSFLLGIDAGSSVTKAAVFTRDGTLAGRAARPVRLRRGREGTVEVDPAAARDAAAAVIREALADGGIAPEQVAAVGICGAMVGLWLVDADGAPLHPGINWEDCRAQAQIDARVAADPAFLSRVFAVSGTALQQGCTLPLLMWFKAHRPELLARARAALTLKDFLRLELTGVVATDRSEAAVAPGNAREPGFDDGLVTLFGLEDHRHLLPPVLASDTLAGRVTPEAAAATGLAAGTPVAVGAGDVPANVIGAGGGDAETLTVILGTTCMLGVARPEPVFTPRDVGLLFSLPDGRWFRAMVNVAGTLALEWALALLLPDAAGGPARYAAAEALATAAGAGAGGVSFLPYLSDSGIIAPVIDARARAQFAGLTPAHGRAEMLRAVYEGVAYAIRDLAEPLGPAGDRAVLIGGGARSRFWAQMIADVLGRPVTVPAGGEFGARGAAALAAAAIGAPFGPPGAGGGGFMPDSASRKDYEAGFARYRAHRDRLLAQ